MSIEFMRVILSKLSGKFDKIEEDLYEDESDVVLNKPADRIRLSTALQQHFLDTYAWVDDVSLTRPLIPRVEVLAAILVGAVDSSLNRKKPSAHHAKYHTCVAHILQNCTVCASHNHLIEDLLDFTKIPEASSMHQLIRWCYSAPQNDINFVDMLVGLLTTRDGVRFPTNNKLVDSCRNFYFRSKLIGTLADAHEVVLNIDPLRSMEWFKNQVELIYARNQNEPIETIRDDVHFLAWFVLLSLVEHTNKVSAIHDLMLEANSILTEHYLRRALK